MRLHEPDFFIHSGDTIYADNPIPDEIALRDGGIWKNRVVTHEKRDVARTLEEYRGQWKYNLLDNHVRELNAVCPTFYQWDDHEVLNNWSASTDLSDDPRYPEKDVAVYAARAARAFNEMTPIRTPPTQPGRIFRKIAYGPLLDVFFVDLRILSRAQPGRGRWRPVRLAPGGLAEAGACRVARRLEGDRLRYARRSRRLGRLCQPARFRCHRQWRQWSADGARDRVCRAAPLHQGQCHRQPRLADGGRALHGRASLRSVAGGLQGFPAVLGVRFRSACIPAPMVRRSWT